MDPQTAEQLISKKCLPCEGIVQKYTPRQARAQLRSLTGWRPTHHEQRIRKDWELKNFLAGIDFFVKVGQLAELQGHHPDFHLEDYRHAWIEIWTHAVGGLSENDFILAAKIDQLPVNESSRQETTSPLGE